MLQSRVLIILANLFIVQLSIASNVSDPIGAVAAQIQPDQELKIDASNTSIQQTTGANMDSIGLVTKPESLNSSNHVEPTKSDLHNEASNIVRNSGVAASSSGAKRRSKSAKSSNPANRMLRLVSSFIEQLDRVDLKRLIAESLLQLQQSRMSVADLTLPLGNRRKFSTPTQPLQTTNVNTNQQHQPNSGANETLKRARPKLNGSAIATETGNIFSITRQLVKLARNGFVGAEFGPLGAIGPALGSSPTNWLGPLIAMPTMLSAAATHAIHAASDHSADFGHHFAASKGDWFWVVMPAIICVGAGVIIVPLIAAWLVSSAMSQNTMTVAAGRRRRRRRRDTKASFSTDPLALESTHSDLFRLLDLHRWLDDMEPETIVSKLARLHKALEFVGTELINSTIAQPNQANSKPAKPTA